MKKNIVQRYSNSPTIKKTPSNKLISAKQQYKNKNSDMNLINEPFEISLHHLEDGELQEDVISSSDDENLNSYGPKGNFQLKASNLISINRGMNKQRIEKALKNL